MKIRSVVRTGINRLRGASTEILYLKTGRDRTRPLSILGIVNERCNQRCRYCGFWCKDPFDEEMTLQAWVAALTSLKEFVGSYLVRFLGGEPFLRRDFLSLVEACHRHGIDWNVCTNGSLLDAETARRVVAAEPFNLDLSVDSPDPAVHDDLRRSRGSLRTIERGIGLLRAERERGGRPFPIRIKSVITVANFRHLPALVDWCVKVGADTVDFSPVRPWTDEVERDLWIDDPADLDELRGIVEELRHRKRDGAPIETPDEQLESFVPHFRRELVRHGATPCRVGLREYHIRTNGDVQICWWLPPIGNVCRESAREIWRGERTRRIRAESVRCTRFSSVDCANSCLSTKTLRQEIERGWLVLGRTWRR
jgi:MoaA/NifB/PqqE/SkfB family radical SAM enzyme